MRTRRFLVLVLLATPLSLLHCVGDDAVIPPPSNGDASDAAVTPSETGPDVGDTVEASTDAALALFDDAVSIAAGRLHTCAISAAQDVYCWGSNASGQLGLPVAQTPRTSRPVRVDIGGKATAVAAGGAHTCVIMLDGTIKCWGKNERGQLGRGTLVPVGGVAGVNPPTDNLTLWTKAEVITAGADHTCVGVFEGDLGGMPGRRFFCWGENIARQLGTNVTNGQPKPIPSLITMNGDDNPNPGLEGFTVAAGDDFSCTGHYGVAGAAFFSTVGCWGSRTNGQIGAPPEANYELAPKYPSRTSDGSVAPLFGLFKPGLLAVGSGHGCVRFEQSGVNPTALDCWGNNTSGQTGSSTIGARPIEKVAGLDANDVTALAAGGKTTCIINAGQVQCIGANDVGQLGRGSIDGEAHPSFINVSLPPSASALAVGASHVCAVLGGAPGAKGSVACWGQNQSGQLGDGLDTDVGYPGASDTEKRLRAAPVRVLAPL